MTATAPIKLNDPVILIDQLIAVGLQTQDAKTIFDNKVQARWTEVVKRDPFLACAVAPLALQQDLARVLLSQGLPQEHFDIAVKQANGLTGIAVAAIIHESARSFLPSSPGLYSSGVHANLTQALLLKVYEEAHGLVDDPAETKPSLIVLQ